MMNERKEVEVGPSEAQRSSAEVLHGKLTLKGKLHFQCTEVSLYSKVMLFLKQIAKCKYH